jgi:RHS repeat-associated protein
MTKIRCKYTIAQRQRHLLQSDRLLQLSELPDRLDQRRQHNLIDAQGSVLISLSTSSSVQVQGEQLFDPYGHGRYTSGTLGTDKGYTGQFTDSVTGLDYYNARYYLRDIGVFLSPDSVQGNAQGFDPYAYVKGNPETMTDPTGHCDGWCWAANIIGVAAVVVAGAALVASTVVTGGAAAVVVAAVLGASTGAAAKGELRRSSKGKVHCYF